MPDAAELGSPADRTGMAASQARFARRLFAGVVFIGVASLLGPLLSYRGDLAETRSLFEGRLMQQARVHSQAMALHFRLLEAELRRLVARREGSPRPPSSVSGEWLTGRTALFDAGLVRLDHLGNVLWSEPPGALPEASSVGESDWFQRLLETDATVFDILGARPGQFVVALPLIDKGETTGAIVGLTTGQLTEIPGAYPATREQTIYLVDATGEPLGTHALPPWIPPARLIQEINREAADSSAEARIDASGSLAIILPVELTRLYVVLASPYDSALRPVRRRLQFQLVYVGLFQLLAVLLFWVIMRTSYRSFVAMETRASEQERLAALGAAAALIAHEVKNGLNGIQAAASLLSRGGDTREPLQVLRAQTVRLSHLAQMLLRFGGTVTPLRVPVKLSAVVDEALARVRLLPEAAEVDIEVVGLEPSAPGALASAHVLADPALLTSVVDNLLRNAVEAAVEAKDTGRVETPRMRVFMEEGPAASLRVCVEDNAGGVSPDMAPRLFVPFASRKPKGIGLGLVMARRAAEAHGGTVIWQLIPGGSRFILQLPADIKLPAEAHAHTRGRPDPSVPGS